MAAASTQEVLAAAQQRGPRIARIYAPVPSSAQRTYTEQVLPALVALVVAWWRSFDAADRAAWHVSASVDTGICIDAPDDDSQDTICCPHNLSDVTLLIGWQRYGNRSIHDPKCEIAERMIELLLGSDVLAQHVEIEEMEDVAEEYGLYQRTRGYVSESEEERAREAREDAEEEKAYDDEEAEDKAAHSHWTPANVAVHGGGDYDEEEQSSASESCSDSCSDRGD